MQLTAIDGHQFEAYVAETTQPPDRVERNLELGCGSEPLRHT
jgi:hypothetical protein